MTNLTIIDRILVLLDDEQPHTLEEMTERLGRTKQTVSSTLGRLLAKQWVGRRPGRSRGQYIITDPGRAHVTDYLDGIKLRTATAWDGSWEQVIFNIPERDRKRRDDLRLLLIELGYGRLHGTLWLSPWSHRQAVEAYLLRTRSEHNVTILRTGSLDQVTNQRIGRLFEWDWAGLERSYDDVITAAQAFLKRPAKTSFEARCVVYQYAKVLAIDPKLPASLPVRIPNAERAFELYQQVRPYCYSGRS